MMACVLGDVDQDRRDAHVISIDVIRRRLCRKGVKDILRKASRKIPWHIIGIVRIGAKFATCHNDAGFGSRAR